MEKQSEHSDKVAWRTGYDFAILLLFIIGICLIAIGTLAFENGSFWNVVFVNTGVAMAPAAIVAELFRFFLFKEVKYELTHPVLEEIKNQLGPDIKEQVKEMMREYREEIETWRSLRNAGVIRPYRHRDTAIREFASAIDAETSEIMIIGSSLKGLLQKDEYKEIASKLRFKLDRGGVAVKFLLTHPVVADLRAGQEARRSTEIGKEIIDSLRTLQEWKVPPEYVRLYRGTPTCFAIKTGTQMLLNPYPYGAVAYDSPCLIIRTTSENPSYFYDAFDKSHFGAWDTKVAVKVFSYEETIRDLNCKLDAYSKAIDNMFAQ